MKIIAATHHIEKGLKMEISNIIVGILALIGSLVGCYFSNSKTMAVTQERLRQLDEKVEKHNQVIERTYKLESDVRTAFVEIDELKERLK